MTVKQHKSDILYRVYRAVIDYWADNQLPPSLGDITKATGYVSRSNIWGYLVELEELGFLKVDRSKARCILVVGSKWTPPSQEVIMAIAKKEYKARSVLL